MLVYFDEIPSDRETELYADSSPDGIYSYMVNANEIKEGRYYVSIQCSELDDADIAVLAKFEPSHLYDGKSEHFMICPKETLYHYINLTKDESESKYKHVNFRLCIPYDSMSNLALVTKVHHPPLRRAEPMKLLDASRKNASDNPLAPICVDFDVCHDALESGHVWAGVFGSGLCGDYNLTATVFTSSTCTPEKGTQSAHGAEAHHLKLEHVVRGSCEPYEWVDYELHLDDYDRRNNLVFEVKDLSQGINPESLAVYLFIDEIPTNRASENRAERSVSAVYAVFKNYFSLREMIKADGTPVETIFLSVRCNDQPASFRALGEHVSSHLYDHHMTRGEICAGYWVYHYIYMPSDANATASLEVAVSSYEGEVEFTVSTDHPPIRLSPPYGIASPDGENNVDVTVCEAEAGVKYYVGVRNSAGGGCAVYDIMPTVQLEDPDCSAARQSAPERGVDPEVLAPYVPLSDAVNLGEFKVYKIPIDHEHSHDNLLVEVRKLDKLISFFASPSAESKQVPFCFRLRSQKRMQQLTHPRH